MTELLTVHANREKLTYEILCEEDEMCKTERLHLRFTTWDAFERTILQVKKDYGDKHIHGEVVIELR